MCSENRVDLSSKLFRVTSIMAIAAIIINVLVDITFSDSINYRVIIPSIILLVFSENSRKKIVSKRDS